MLLMTELTLCSFNVTGVKPDASMYYVYKLLSEEKIYLLMLQETWLKDGQHGVLNNICKDYMYIAKSGTDSYATRPLSRCYLRSYFVKKYCRSSQRAQQEIQEQS